MKRKFNIGDRVLLTKRAPADILRKYRRRARTVVNVFYDKTDQCTYYELGSTGKGRLPGLFRSYMMEPVREPKRIGAPKRKRKYVRK